MSFHYSQSAQLKLNIFIQNSKIAYKPEVQFLGIYIMENLNWQSQIMLLSNTLSKTYYMIRALKQTVSTYILRIIYFVHLQTKMRFIHSFILYLHSIDPILVTLTRGYRNRQTKLNIIKILKITQSLIHLSSVEKHCTGEYQ